MEKLLTQTAKSQPVDGLERVIRAADNPPLREYPLFSYRVPAGFPSPADDYIECGLDLNDFMVVHPSATYYVRVSGDSMLEAGILNGDYLIVDRSIEPYPGMIVVAVVEGELTVKCFYQQETFIELRPENKGFNSIKVTQDMELLIWGVVTGVFRKTL